MRKNVLCSCLAAISLLFFADRKAQAQSGEPKVELGAQFSIIRFRDLQAFDPTRIVIPRKFDKTNAGFGGRVSYNLTRMVAVEGEINFFPGEDEEEGGQKFQGLAGVKAGARNERIGLFAKARPGVVRFSRLTDCPNAQISECGRHAKTEFALDLGAVVELYPSRRSFVRFDFGDTLIFNSERVLITIVPGPGGSGTESARTFFSGETTHNFQFSVGVGIRF
jgi:hypothetical protein